MPDKKTVYMTDDSYNGFFSKFVADTAEDLSAAKAAVARCRQLWVSQRQQVAAARKLEIEGEPAAAVAAAAELLATVASTLHLVKLNLGV